VKRQRANNDATRCRYRVTTMRNLKFRERKV